MENDRPLKPMSPLTQELVNSAISNLFGGWDKANKVSDLISERDALKAQVKRLQRLLVTVTNGMTMIPNETGTPEWGAWTDMMGKLAGEVLAAIDDERFRWKIGE